MFDYKGVIAAKFGGLELWMLFEGLVELGDEFHVFFIIFLCVISKKTCMYTSIRISKYSNH